MESVNTPLIQRNRPVVILVDNSVSFTGAFKCALQQAMLLQDEYDYIFILPVRSDLLSIVKAKGFRCYALPMLEIKKSTSVLIQYLPKLLQNAGQLKKIIKSEAADVVIMNDFYNLLGVAIKILGYKGWVITYVRFLPSAIPSFLRKIWLFLATKYADQIIAVSDAVFHQLPASKKIRKIYDAVCFSENLPEKTVGNGTSVNLLYLGNYILGKGHDHALAAFQIAYNKNPSLQLSFAGGDMGLKKNKQFKERLQKEVTDAGLTDVVKFLPFEKDIEGLFKKSDIFLNFSEAESFSMTCAEASFYGIPIIATRCGGPEEIVVHQQTGLLVENKNIEQMAEAILTLASSPNLQCQFSVNAKAYVREKFRSDRFVNSFNSLLVDLLRPVL